MDFKTMVEISQDETYESNFNVTARAIAPNSVCELIEFHRLRGLPVDYPSRNDHITELKHDRNAQLQKVGHESQANSDLSEGR